MARLLVTGGAGFIGSNFVHDLINHTDHHVTVLDKLTHAGNLASLAGLPEERMTFVHGDVADPELVEDLVAATDANGHVPDRSGHDLRYVIDSTKLRIEIGWLPRYCDFEHGLSATIDWYRDHEDWWAPAKDATAAFCARLGQ